MKTLIHSIVLLVAIAVFSFGCEGHNFAETQKLHKSHGAHGEHEEGGEADHSDKHESKDGEHAKKKKEH